MRKNRRGEGHVQTCVFVLVICMVASSLITFATSLSILRYTKENVILTLDSHVMNNAVSIFDAIKQGSNDLEVVDKTAYVERLRQFCKLDQRGEFLYAYDEDGGVIYYMTVPEFTETDTLQLEVSYTQYLPIRLIGEIEFYVHVPVKVTSNLTSKF